MESGNRFYIQAKSNVHIMMPCSKCGSAWTIKELLSYENYVICGEEGLSHFTKEITMTKA